MCGNGGRCIAAFAFSKGYKTENINFEAIDGEHNATLEESGLVNLKMQNVSNFEKFNRAYIVNTGSPHYVEFVEDLNNFDVYTKGKAIRHDSKFEPKGTNVNFVEIINNELFVRTFERGVENETLSCGTGVVASAIAARLKGFSAESDSYKIITKGGVLNVKFTLSNNENEFVDVWLKGPAEKVFKGTYNS
ncbi:MAG: diaminopimelate epimerase, partial [Bacteroidales bacterium]